MKGVRIMKKFVAVLMISFLFLLCGCTRSTSGRIDELRKNSWEAQFEGGATVSLSFDGDEASLLLENAGERAIISGKCLINDSELVIFVPELGQNYGFSYVPKGKTLELSFGDETVILNRK